MNLRRAFPSCNFVSFVVRAVELANDLALLDLHLIDFEFEFPRLLAGGTHQNQAQEREEDGSAVLDFHDDGCSGSLLTRFRTNGTPRCEGEGGKVQSRGLLNP
jgi:hypothetical protein